jgi:hypothetical protein
VPGIEHISGNTVTFTDGRAVEADMIVLATGYTQRFPFLYDRGEATSEGEDPLPTERFVVNASEPRLGFIGRSRAVLDPWQRCLPVVLFFLAPWSLGRTFVVPKSNFHEDSIAFCMA